MKIAEQHLLAVRALGYTRSEARFLYLVATYSGYFVPRQFLNLSGAKWGYRTSHFTSKLQGCGHAIWREQYAPGGVYRLCSKELYGRIGRADLHARRQHSCEFIQKRLLILDFVIANQQHEYLETEDEKLSYFAEQLGISRTVLPAKVYGGRPLLGPLQRYFVDQFPVFLNRSGNSSASLVTFCYVDVGDASVAGFRHHLEVYRQLLANLPAFEFLYLSNSTINFRAAERCFEDFASTFGGHLTAASIRHSVQRARPGRREGEESPSYMNGLPGEGIEQSNGRLAERFDEDRCAGDATEAAIASTSAIQIPGTRWAGFALCLVPRERGTARESGEFGSRG